MTFAYSDGRRIMDKVLRLGIIGLGRRWQKRYKPALRVLRGRFEVTVLCDQVQERAVREAKRMACDAAAGPTQLLERQDVDAVLFLDAQWFRLWPLERACQMGKPVFCCCSLEWDEAHADAVLRQVQESQVPVVMEMAPRFLPVTARLRSLFEGELGAPRLLLCDVVHSRQVPTRCELTRTPERSPVASLVGGTGITLLDWCAGLLQGEPVNVTARSLEPIGFSSLFLEFAGGRGVQLTRRHGVVDRPVVRLQVVAERGSALVELPYRVSWGIKEGFHSDALREQHSLTPLLLEHFREVIQGVGALEPTLQDAYRVLRWLRVAVRSRDEGRLLPLTG
jgi:predicted dehydrogenase